MNRDIFKIFPEFETERLKLRQFTENDYKDYISWHKGDIVYFMQGLHFTTDKENFSRLFLKNVPRMFKSKESIIWCIADKTTNKSIGKLEMCKFDFYANTAQIHYCMSNDNQKKGYTTEAVNRLIDWSFDTLNVNRISTTVWEENLPSIKVLLKCGFKLEGTFEQASVNKCTKNGEVIKVSKNAINNPPDMEYKNECVYALLKKDYLS